MCLILISYRKNPDYRLILAANRDEFYDRPTEPAAFWEDSPQILGGKDLKAGGTWLGINKSGRFAAITNYRDPGSNMPDAPSRGALVRGFLESTEAPLEYFENLKVEAGKYNGFNLIAGDLERLCYFSNRYGNPIELPPGIYGLSNHLLDTPWPKVELGKHLLRSVVNKGSFSPEEIFHLLANRERPNDESLPETGVGLEWERILSSVFITSLVYGTRSSTTVMMDNSGEVTFIEKVFNAHPVSREIREFHFRIEI